MVARRDDELSAWAAFDRATRRLTDAAAAQAAAQGWLRTERPGDLTDPVNQANAAALLEARRQALLDLAGRHRLDAALDALTARGANPPPSTALIQFKVLLPWLNGLASGDDMLDQLLPDPRRRFLGTPPAFDPALADAMIAYVAAHRPIGTLAVFDGVQGPKMDDDDFWDLLSTGARRQAGPLPAGQSVGVLLPLRLVTRFLGPEPDGTWRMRVRVYPDDACRDRAPRPADVDELEAVRAMWEACAGDLTSATGEIAFRRLADAVGAPRAAWLVRAVTVEPGPAGFEVRSPAPAAADGPATYDGLTLPATLEVWARWTDGTAQRLATLAVDAAEAARQLNLEAIAEAAGPAAELPAVWWTDWSAAEKVNLAVEVALDRPPEDLAVLSVVGLGDEPPGPFWLRQRDSGRLSVLAPGTATNTVDGSPAADAGDPVKTWWHVAQSSGLGEEASADVSLALTGGSAFLGPLPGGDLDRRSAAQLAVELLWPVIFGRALQDVWDTGTAGDAVADWAARLFSPEGAYPAVRLGDQPYAVLPATSAADWRPAPDDPAVERDLLRVAGALRDQLVSRAEAAGTVVGADTERLLDLLSRTPRSSRPQARTFIPLALLRRAAEGAGDLAGFDGFAAWWRDRNLPPISTVTDPDELPLRMYLAWSWSSAPGDAGRDPKLLWRALEALQEVDVEGIDFQLSQKLGFKDRDDVAIEDIADHLWARSDRLVPGPLPLLARLTRHSLVLTKADLGRRQRQDRPWRRSNVLPVTRPQLLYEDAHFLGPRRVPLPPTGGPDVAAELPDGPAVARRYRRVRAALDALLDRGDHIPVIDDLLGPLVDTASYRVDPWFTGMANRRFRSLVERGAPVRLGAYGWVDAPAPWAARPPGTADLPPGPTVAGLIHAPSPDQARTAALLRAQAVYHAADSRWDLQLDSARIRRAQQLAAQVRAGVPPIEVLGRHVEEIAGDPGTVAALRRQFPMRVEHGERRVCDGAAVLDAVLSGGPPIAAALSASQRAAIADLQGDADAYADLCVAEGVHNALHRRPEAAAVAMDAAAGLGPPPEPEVLRTQREGSSVVTTAFVALRAATAPGGAPPAQLADPSFAAEAQAATGAPGDPAWTWTVGDQEVAVTLASLGLIPADVAVLAPAVLDRLVVAAAAAGEGPAITGRAVLAARQVRALAALLDGPVELPPALATPLTDLERADATTGIADDLKGRLSALIAAARATVVSLRAGHPDALGAARRFGVEAPDSQAAADVLDARVTAAQAVAEAPEPGLPVLASALRSLLGAAGPFPVLATIPASLLAWRKAPAVAADRWREVVAAVREPIARLDAWQHSTHTGRWSAWCDTPDPWGLPGLPAVRPPHHQVIVVHGPPPDAGDTLVATVTIDRVVETVPSTRQTTGAAFGFNGPRARAPQAVVLAVPPDESRPLDTETLIAIVEDLRRSARARAVGPDDLDDLIDLLPLPVVLRPTSAGCDPLGEED